MHLFGVCKTEGGQNHQLNFVIGENELPKGTSKGANTTINMVLYIMHFKNLREMKKNIYKLLVITVLGRTKTIYHFGFGPG